MLTLLLHALIDTSGSVREEAVAALWKTCPLVQMIIFGPKISEQGGNDRHTVWNPDVSSLTVPMTELKRILLHVETYDFHLVERFVTYAINTFGQKHLRKDIEVHIYGNPDHLHINLWNTIRNLFRHIQIHEK